MIVGLSIYPIAVAIQKVLSTALCFNSFQRTGWIESFVGNTLEKMPALWDTLRRYGIIQPPVSYDP
jgi:hypothetical protein